MLKKLSDYISSRWNTLNGHKGGQHFPMFGLSNANKSTLLFRLAYTEFIQTLGDHNFRLETFTIPNVFRQGDEGGTQSKELRFTLWDVARQTGFIPYWPAYVDEIRAKGVIFVVDSTCQQTMWYAKAALWSLFEHYDAQAAKAEEEGKKIEGEKLALLVFANKQDRFDAMTLADVMSGLDLEGLCDGSPRGAERRSRQKRRWHIRGTVATTGEGVVEGLLWLDWQVNGPSRSKEGIVGGDF